MDCRSGWMCAWMGECMWVWGGGSECECVIEYTHIRDLSNMPGTFVFTVGQPGEMNPLWGPQKKPVRGRTQMSFPFKPRGLRSQSRLHQHQLLPSSFVSLRHWCSDVSDPHPPILSLSCCCSPQRILQLPWLLLCMAHCVYLGLPFRQG